MRSVTASRRTSRDAACTMVIGRDTANMGPTCVRASGVTCSQAVISWLPANSNHQHVVCVNNVEVSQYLSNRKRLLLFAELYTERYLFTGTFIGPNRETRRVSPYHHWSFTQHPVQSNCQSETFKSWSAIWDTHRRSPGRVYRLQNPAQRPARPTERNHGTYNGNMS